jgi:hypothetical protein
MVKMLKPQDVNPDDTSNGGQIDAGKKIHSSSLSFDEQTSHHVILPFQLKRKASTTSM